MRSPRAVARVARASTVLLLLGSGCGYFNALYNAQRKFDDALRAEASGDRALAIIAYDAAIDRAAVSYKRYPNGRWADDALLLIGRSHFGRATNSQTDAGDRQAIAALQHLLRETHDLSIRTQAFAYLGASLTRLRTGDALTPLDSAALTVDAASDLGAFTHLWRARARFAAGDTAGAWQDLESIAAASAGVRSDAAIERVVRSITLRDSTRWKAAVHAVTGPNGPSTRPDSMRLLLRASADLWGPGFVRRALPLDIEAPLEESDRLAFALERAELTAAAGDTTAAITEGLRVAGASASDVSSLARVHVGQWMLATASDPQEFARIRSILVPAFANGDALQTIRQIRTLDVLIDRGVNDPLAMFVAAEYARDDLGSPRVARTLFLRVDSIPARAAWSGKALIAALDLSTSDAERRQVEARIARAAPDVYLNAMHGSADSAAYTSAELKLRREGTALRAEATAIALAGDVTIARAVTLRDSIRNVLRRDSVQHRCLDVLDSLKTSGVRGDSARAACVRVDTVRFNAVMKMDTVKLKTRGDTLLFLPVRPSPGGR